MFPKSFSGRAWRHTHLLYPLLQQWGRQSTPESSSTWCRGAGKHITQLDTYRIQRVYTITEGPGGTGFKTSKTSKKHAQHPQLLFITHQFINAFIWCIFQAPSENYKAENKLSTWDSKGQQQCLELILSGSGDPGTDFREGNTWPMQPLYLLEWKKIYIYVIKYTHTLKEWKSLKKKRLGQEAEARNTPRLFFCSSFNRLCPLGRMPYLLVRVKERREDLERLFKVFCRRHDRGKVSYCCQSPSAACYRWTSQKHREGLTESVWFTEITGKDGSLPAFPRRKESPSTYSKLPNQLGGKAHFFPLLQGSRQKLSGLTGDEPVHLHAWLTLWKPCKNTRTSPRTFQAVTKTPWRWHHALMLPHGSSELLHSLRCWDAGCT